MGQKFKQQQQQISTSTNYFVTYLRYTSRKIYSTIQSNYPDNLNLGSQINFTHVGSSVKVIYARKKIGSPIFTLANDITK